MALRTIIILLTGTAIGSMAPEFGDIVAVRLGIRAHAFNTLFLALGIAGIGVALYLGYTQCSNGSQILVVGQAR